MHSKHWARIGVMVSLVMALGCAGESERATRVPDVRFDSVKFSCLRNADEVAEKFIEGSVSAGELQTFWNCLDLVIVQFVKFVNGSDGQHYTPKELARFLDDHFLDGRGLAEEEAFLAELMEIKKLFVGGTTRHVSHYDLYVRTRQLFQEFKSITVELNPHMRVLHHGLAASGRKSGLTDAEIEAASRALHRAGQRLGKLITDGRHFYSFSHLQALVNELEKFIAKTRPGFEFANTKRYLPLFAELKGLMVSPPSDLIRNEDWTQLLGTLTNILTWSLRYRYYVEEQDWDQGRPLASLETIILGGLGELERGLQRQPHQEFAFLDLDRLIELLEDLDLLPSDLDATTTKNVIRRLAERILAPAGGLGNGLNVADLAALRAEIERWLEAQKFINQHLATGRVVETGGGAEMLALMQTKWPLLVDGDGRLRFSREAFLGRYDRPSLTALNWQRAIIRALMRGYAPQSSPDGATGLTREQLTELAKDWHVLAEKLGIFEPGEAESMAKKLFMEANLFMPSANGNDRLEFTEATHYLSFGVSGLNGSALIRDAIQGACSDPGAPNKFVATCVRSELFKQRTSLLAHLPGLLGFIGEDENRWLRFEGHIEATIRDGLSQKPFTRGELIELLVLLQYIETFYASYDANLDQRIQVDETLVAFPVFNRSLDDIVKSSFGINMGEEDLLALFTFLFKYGKPPQSSLGGMVKFLNWRWRTDKWRYDADRNRVIQILAELNSRR